MKGFPSTFTRVRGLLGRERQWAALLPEAERLRELNRRFARAVSPALARACQIVAVTQGEVVVHCASGVAASRLRGQAASVARALSRPDQPLSGLKIRVRADWSTPPKPEKAGLNNQALAAWEDLEARLPEGDLKAAIDRLVRHQRR